VGEMVELSIEITRSSWQDGSWLEGATAWFLIIQLQVMGVHPGRDDCQASSDL